MKSKSSIDLLGLGIAPVDFFTAMEHFPKKGDKIDSIPGSNVIAGGGPVPNALCTFSKLGGKAALISSFGDDLWGDFARRELDRFGVGHKHCIIRKNCPTPQAFAWIEAGSGDRTIVLSRNEKLRLRSHDIKISDLPKPKLIHLDGRDMEACLKLGRWGKKKRRPSYARRWLGSQPGRRTVCLY